MDKKDLKWYESPAAEVVELEVEGFLCASPNPDDPFDGQTAGGEQGE